eukprot:jgi/Ulvmu1/3306/UM153_0018.1
MPLGITTFRCPVGWVHPLRSMRSARSACTAAACYACRRDDRCSAAAGQRGWQAPGAYDLELAGRDGPDGEGGD